MAQNLDLTDRPGWNGATNEVTRHDNDLVDLRITAAGIDTGIAGPSANYSVLFSLDLLGDASQKIRKSLDQWLSDQDPYAASSATYS